MSTSFMPPKRILMGPGPSDVNQRVLNAMARPTIGHLDPAFVGLMDEIKQQLRAAFRTDNELTMPVSAPGSVGMETCLINLLEPGDTIVICENGVFGGRMRQIAERCGATVVSVKDEWGRAIDTAKVEQALAENPEASVLAFVHAETSTGALSDAKTLAEIARKHNALTVVDTVTSFAGCELEVDAWGLDAVYTGTQKCLSCPPGLSPITFSERAVARLAARKTPVQSWFMDLNLVMTYWKSGGKRSYHHTAPVNALYGLHESLLILLEEGLENAWARHLTLHQQLVAGLADLGVNMVVPEGERVPQLNEVWIPQGVDDAATRKALLEEYNLEIGAGLGDLGGKVWRIGLMGASATQAHVDLCLQALSSVMHEAA